MRIERYQASAFSANYADIRSLMNALDGLNIESVNDWFRHRTTYIFSDYSSLSIHGQYVDILAPEQLTDSLQRGVNYD